MDPSNNNTFSGLFSRLTRRSRSSLSFGGEESPAAENEPHNATRSEPLNILASGPPSPWTPSSTSDRLSRRMPSILERGAVDIPLSPGGSYTPRQSQNFPMSPLTPPSGSLRLQSTVATLTAILAGKTPLKKDGAVEPMSPYISSSGRSALPPSIIPAKQPIGSRVPSNKGSAFITAEQPHQIDSLSFGEQTVPPDLFDDTGPDEIHHNAVPGYIIGRKIGDGGFSNVHIGYWPARKLKVAVKIVDKKRLIEDPNDETLLRRELRAMRHLEGERSVIRLYASYETAGFFYLVIEYLGGGTVLEYVRKRKTLSKADAARFLGQTAEALRQCHQKQVIHRDVKLENLMLDENGNIKLIDFGLCAFFASGQRLRVFCGSPSYASPEIIAEKEYEGPPVDVWSLGVCFFALLMGFLPFYNTRGKKDINEKIMEGRLGKFSDHILRSSVKGLIEGMLAVNPADRLTLDEVLNHEWLRRYRE